MATNTAGTNARDLQMQAVHYLRKRVNFGDTGISSGLAFANPIPSGARILETAVFINTAFNAATTNVLTVGQNSTSYNDCITASDVDESTTGVYRSDRGGALSLTSDTTFYVKYTQTGTAATTGQADVVITYVLNNDA